MAEDNEVNRNMLVDLLEDEGVICDTAEDGLEAVQFFEEAPPGRYDAVLMDIQMPRMDGLRLRGESVSHRMPMHSIFLWWRCLLTAFTEDIEKSRDAGMNEYITKPINIVELCKLLNHLITLSEERA